MPRDPWQLLELERAERRKNNPPPPPDPEAVRKAEIRRQKMIEYYTPILTGRPVSKKPKKHAQNPARKESVPTINLPKAATQSPSATGGEPLDHCLPEDVPFNPGDEEFADYAAEYLPQPQQQQPVLDPSLPDDVPISPGDKPFDWSMMCFDDNLPQATSDPQQYPLGDLFTNSPPELSHFDTNVTQVAQQISEDELLDILNAAEENGDLFGDFDGKDLFELEIPKFEDAA